MHGKPYVSNYQDTQELIRRIEKLEQFMSIMQVLFLNQQNRIPGQFVPYNPFQSPYYGP